MKSSASYVVALQEMGAILLGKTALHEIGMGVTGLNLRTGTARNPWDYSRFCGGSSSGSAAVIAAGICPIAVGERPTRTLLLYVCLLLFHAVLLEASSCTPPGTTAASVGASPQAVALSLL